MCGFLCYISFNEIINPSALKKGLKQLNHRGPDSKDIVFTNKFFFGHQRLKIIDLSENASQPMASFDGRYLIVFNGEIYNYKSLKKELSFEFKNWKSRSDTEVILNSYLKWGVKCLDKFEGIFSFVIYDKNDETIFASRDRMGVKPLYYKYDTKGITLSSRPEAITKSSKENLNFCQDALNIYLKAGYVPAPYSIYKGIKQLEGGNYLFFDKNKNMQKIRWWFPNKFFPNISKKLIENDLIDELETLLINSIKYRLVADVPVGIFLSGGLDSSLIAAMATKISNSKINTYSIGFKERKFDESIFSKKVSNHIKSNHFSKIMSINELLNLLPIFQKKFDEPFSDAACFPTMALSELAYDKQKVVLSGDGSDELFGGYHYYNILSKIKNFYILPNSIKKLIQIFVGILPFHKSKLLYETLDKKNLINCFSFMRSVSKDYTFSENLNEFDTIFYKSFLEMPPSLNIEEVASRLDLYYTLGNGYLQKLDLSTMAFSIEAREPFLDSSILKFALKLPWSFKVNKGVSKYLLKKVALRYLPEEIIFRKKRGFEVPISTWLNKDLEKWAIEKIYNKELFYNLPFSQKDILNLYKVHKKGFRNVTPCLWNILVLLNFIELKS